MGRRRDLHAQETGLRKNLPCRHFCYRCPTSRTGNSDSQSELLLLGCFAKGAWAHWHRGQWWAAVHRVAQSWIRLKRLSMHALEKENAFEGALWAQRDSTRTNSLRGVARSSFLVGDQIPASRGDRRGPIFLVLRGLQMCVEHNVGSSASLSASVDLHYLLTIRDDASAGAERRTLSDHSYEA